MRNYYTYGIEGQKGQDINKKKALKITMMIKEIKIFNSRTGKPR